VVPRNDVPFGGLETKIEWCEKPPFWGPGFGGTLKIFGIKPLNNGDAQE